MSKEWILFDTIIQNWTILQKSMKFKFKTNFDLERISNLFSDLTSLTYFDLLAWRKIMRLLDIQLVK